jgi:hypothetical protein
MDNCNAFVEVVKATAWPITTIFMVVLFYAEIRVLLGKLKKGKIGSAEFEFQEEVRGLVNDMASIVPTSGAMALSSDVMSLATKNPRVALLQSWSDIQTALTDLARKHDLLNVQTSNSYSALVRALVKAELIPMSYALGIISVLQLYEQTKQVINFKPSEEAVLGYLKISEKLKQILIEAEKLPLASANN